MKFLIITNNGNSSIIETEDILSAVEESWNSHYGYDHILSVTRLEDETDDE